MGGVIQYKQVPDHPLNLRRAITSRMPLIKKQFAALAILCCAGLAPFFIVLKKTDNFHGVFAKKSISCSDYAYDETSSDTGGWEALFTLDDISGKFSFAEAKSIDVSWDVAVGRGVQLLFWYIGYYVFSDALLRLVERHPAPYQTFTDLTLQGPSIISIWTLLKDLFRTSSRRTCALFIFMVLSIIYILSTPVFIGAMTGYVSRTTAWVTLEGSSEMVPYAECEPRKFIVWGVKEPGSVNITRIDDCSASETIDGIIQDLTMRLPQCQCQTQNGSLVPSQVESLYQLNPGSTLKDNCTFAFPNNNQTYIANGKTLQCSSPFGNVTLVDGTSYRFEDLKINFGTCYKNREVPTANIWGNMRCLPNPDQTYNWGFSTAISSLFVMINLVWSLAMYAVWQDAQFNSDLVKKGFVMSPLKAAFVVTIVAIERTGLGYRELLRSKHSNLRSRLYGDKHDRAEVTYDIFSEGDGKRIWDEDEDSLRQRSTGSTYVDA